MVVPKEIVLMVIKEHKGINKEVFYAIINFILFNGGKRWMSHLVIGMLKVYDYVFALLDSGAMLSFIYLIHFE